MNRTTTIALTGDSFITRRLTPFDEPAFRALLGLIRGASTAFTNLEVVLHDYEAPPMNPGGGTHARGAPQLAKDLQWAGFDLVSRANNHAGDFGTEGLRATTKHLDAIGLVHAGVGESLEEAREARYLETSAARVALVSAATTFPEYALAADARQGVLGRPGLNPLRTETEITLTRTVYDELASVCDRAGITRPHRGLGLQPPFTGEGFHLAGNFVRPGRAPEVAQAFAADDVAAIRGAVQEAAAQADLVIVSLHTHEAGEDATQPPEHLRAFCRQLAEDGASTVVCHGPHRLRGVEVVGSCPIFHSLGNFIFQNETVHRLPAESYRTMGLSDDAQVSDLVDARSDGGQKGFPASPEYWESVVAVPQWDGRELATISLHPVVLGFGCPRTVRGRPMIADREDAERIMAEFVALSDAYGAVIKDQGDGWRLNVG